MVYKCKKIPEKPGQINYHYREKDLTLVSLTNNFQAEALEVGALYKNRWLAELFLKWQIPGISAFAENTYK
jgi:hypothetical protein